MIQNAMPKCNAKMIQNAKENDTILVIQKKEND